MINVGIDVHTGGVAKIARMVEPFLGAISLDIIKDDCICLAACGIVEDILKYVFTCNEILPKTLLVVWFLSLCARICKLMSGNLSSLNFSRWHKMDRYDLF